jgi:TatD DNase family protein
MPQIIETHAHIYDEQFEADRDDMLQRAFELGVEQIWMPNCNHETIVGMMKLESQYPGKCVSMMGLHPCYVSEDFEKELDIVETWLNERKFIMIGEIGLDFYWDLTFVPQQEKVFLHQLSLAKKYNLPICIHSRNSKDNSLNAIQRCCDLIEEFGWKELKGIFHCFSGNEEDAKRVLSLNFLLGIGGVVTFKNGGLDKFLADIPLEMIVLETDSPYLAPVPHRGKRNEVCYLDLIVTKIGDIYEISEDKVKSQTTENAKKLIQK